MSTQSAALSGTDERAGSSPVDESSNTGTSAETSSKVAKLYRTKRFFWRFEIGMVTTRTQPFRAGYQQAQQPVREAAAQPVLAFSSGAPKPQALMPEMGVAAVMAPPAGSNSGTSETTRRVYGDWTAGVTDMPPPNPPGPPKM
jgi:hypothetical protein